MICFSFYMAAAWERIPDRSYLIALYVVQWIFNVGWNPVFFNFQKVFAGLVIIAALAILVGYFSIWIYQRTQGKCTLGFSLFHLADYCHFLEWIYLLF